ncbi:MAG: alkaline phosphatase [Candidatus Riflebacteria bacterium]
MLIAGRKLFLSLFVFIFLVSLVNAAENQPKNIIVMIGDGMGISHISATDFEFGPLQMRRFKKMGLQITSSSNDYVTDSAAAATVLATGILTKNAMVGMDPDKKVLKNLFEYAKDAGKKTGLVVTSTINHATPAAFSTHVEHRDMYNEIAEQQVNSNIDVMIGGGMCNLIPDFMPGSRRKDNKNLLFMLRRKMPVVQTIDGFRQLGKPDKFAAILSGSHLPRATEREYSLGELTQKALEVLDQSEKGFVLLIEGSQIDLVAHKNDYNAILTETLDFDRAVKTVLDFAEKDGNTLVLCTADHETGGLTLPAGSLDEKKAKAHFSTDQHSATMVAVFCYGPGSDLFGGIIENTDIGKNLIELVK